MARYVVAALIVLFALQGGLRADPTTPVQLPYIFHDDSGSTWDVQYDGSIGDGGNDLYDGGGRLFINNMVQYQAQNQQAMLDSARNEITLPAMQMGGVNVSRKVAVFPALSTLRFTEVVENPTAAAMKVQLRCYFNMGQAVQQAIGLVDEKKPRQPVGYALADQNNAVAMIAAGRSSKFQPRFNYRYNDDNVDIFFDVEVPAHQTVAIVHFQLRRRDAGSAADAWKGIREKDLLKDLPRDLRKRVVNFPAGDGMIGDLDILRGDALDVVELRGGDTYRGTLKIDRLRLQTLYGPITIPVDKVIAMVNVGRFRPSQLIVTDQGEIFGGRLEVEKIKLQLSSGQTTSIPLSQIARLGYRRRPGELEEWNFDNKATAYLRSGERIRIKAPAADFHLATPSGPIRLNPSMISSIVFQAEESNVPEIHLTDGSKLSGLLGANHFETSLVGLGVEQPVRLPAAGLLRFSFAPEKDVDAFAATFTLFNHDELVGTVGGTLSVETPFDTLHVEGQQIKAMAHTQGGEHDVQITMWDDSTVSGRLVESHITCLLKCGLSVRVPVGLIEQYDQPLPLPSPAMIKEIQRVVRQFDADEWKVRERAQSQILAIGPPAMAVLKQVQPSTSPGASQIIDLMLNRLSSQLDRARGISEPDPEMDFQPPAEAGVLPLR